MADPFGNWRHRIDERGQPVRPAPEPPQSGFDRLIAQEAGRLAGQAILNAGINADVDRRMQQGREQVGEYMANLPTLEPRQFFTHAYVGSAGIPWNGTASYRRVASYIEPWYDRQLGDFPTPEYERIDTQAADRRARDLLVRKLSPSQWDQYEKDQTFEVVGSKSGKRYRIKSHKSHNVIELDKQGKPVQSLCAGPLQVPLGDYLLAQKVWIETNEPDFVKTANKSKL